MRVIFNGGILNISLLNKIIITQNSERVRDLLAVRAVGAILASRVLAALAVGAVLASRGVLAVLAILAGSIVLTVGHFYILSCDFNLR